MARFTIYACMRARERKTRTAMIEGGILPIAGVMAGGTDRAELPVVGIVFGVTGHTIPGCALEYAAPMTCRTLGFRMSAA